MSVICGAPLTRKGHILALIRVKNHQPFFTPGCDSDRVFSKVNGLTNFMNAVVYNEVILKKKKYAVCN